MSFTGRPISSHNVCAEAMKPDFITSASSNPEYVFPICGANQEAVRDLGKLLSFSDKPLPYILQKKIGKIFYGVLFFLN